MVPGGGFEPPRENSHCDLNAARLPIPPLRHFSFDIAQYYTAFFLFCKSQDEKSFIKSIVVLDSQA